MHACEHTVHTHLSRGVGIQIAISQAASTRAQWAADRWSVWCQWRPAKWGKQKKKKNKQLRKIQ